MKINPVRKGRVLNPANLKGTYILFTPLDITLT
jgi:hypothetical protein